MIIYNLEGTGIEAYESFLLSIFFPILFLFSVILYHFVSLGCLLFLLFGFIKLSFIFTCARNAKRSIIYVSSMYI